MRAKSPRPDSTRSSSGRDALAALQIGERGFGLAPRLLGAQAATSGRVRRAALRPRLRSVRVFDSCAASSTAIGAWQYLTGGVLADVGAGAAVHALDHARVDAQRRALRRR